MATPQDKVEEMLLGPIEGDELEGESPEAASEALQEEIEEDQGVEAAEEENAVEDDSEPLSEDEQETSFVEVEFDGVLYEVPENLKDALMRQSDYTQKTQEVSAQRKAAEVQIGELENRSKQFQFAESIWDNTMKVQTMGNDIKQYQDYLRTNIDALSSTDIEKIRFHTDKLRQQQQELSGEIQQKYTDFQQSQQQSFRELLNKGTEVLKQRIPDWSADTQKQVVDYGLSQGFTEQELSTLVDPRQVEVLYKAQQYDALKKGATPVKEKLGQAPAIKTKSRNPMPKDVRRKLDTKNKLKRKGQSATDKEKIIQEDIARRLGI